MPPQTPNPQPSTPNSLLQLFTSNSELQIPNPNPAHTHLKPTPPPKLGSVQTSCERIATTPLPFPYVLLVHRTAIAYVLLAPFAMAGQVRETEILVEQQRS